MKSINNVDYFIKKKRKKKKEKKKKKKKKWIMSSLHAVEYM